MLLNMLLNIEIIASWNLDQLHLFSKTNTQKKSDFSDISQQCKSEMLGYEKIIEELLVK